MVITETLEGATKRKLTVLMRFFGFKTVRQTTSRLPCPILITGLVLLIPFKINVC